ncbi:MAG: DUF177 domain-containing protein [Sphingobacteriales bacterium]|nr:MAG: DUF177 domain-containing protein [Sphingobacteriales bacterium]
MGRRDYDIAFVGLRPGIHEYEYAITDQFFEAYQEQDFKNCNAQIKLTLDKKSGFILLKFEIGGALHVTCDRCGSPALPLQLWDEFNIVVKLVDDPDVMNNQEEDPDVYYINRGESHLHIADWIYEFINLSIPMQKMCDEAEIGSEFCSKEALDILKKMDDMPEQQENPIWKDLEKLKKNLGE